MSRRTRCSFFAAACVMSPLITGVAAAQVVGTASRAADFGPVDASGLGVSRQSSVSVAARPGEIVGGGALGIWNGSLHAYFGAGALEWSTGVAYSRTAFSWRPVPGIRATLGEQLSGGYRGLSRSGSDAAVNLRVPIGVTLGNPDGASFAAYAAPYGELGVEHLPGQRCDFVSCTRTGMEYRGMNAAGIGLGLRASAGRFAIGILFADLAYRKRFQLPNPSSIQTLGVSVQLGK